MLAFTLFDTPIGRCGIAWREAAVVRFQLPERTEAATRARIARGGAAEGVAPEPVRAAIGLVRAHLSGDLDDLRGIAVDLAGVGEFERAVYDFARAIAPGDVTTYGELARAINAPGAAQAVGQALGRNPIPVIVPCHRILAAGGAMGGFSAYGATVTKRTLLEIERAPGFDVPTLF